MTKIVAIYGGSFNPSTKAHLNVGRLVLEQLPVDEVWYLVAAQNPFKSKDGMASFQDRVDLARLNLKGHPRLIVQDIEAKYAAEKQAGSLETADTLKNLTRDFPDHRFIWIMGADNFATFHRWGNARYIWENYPIAITPRHGYTQSALDGPSANIIPRIDQSDDMRSTNGWYLLQTKKENNINATQCAAELAAGILPKGMFRRVAREAHQRGIYSALTMNKG